MPTKSRLRKWLQGLRKRNNRKTRRSLYEPLEDRLLLSLSPETQKLVYDLNLARHDPAKFQQDAGLTVDLSGVPSRPPLAISTALSEAAQSRAAEMAEHDYFSHQSPVTGNWPNQVAREHGYDLPSSWPDNQNYIESIAAGTYFATPDGPLTTLITDSSDPDNMHRRHLLGIDDLLADHKEIGVGHAFDQQSEFGHYWSIMTAFEPTSGIFLSGVVFDDVNHNGRYDLDEGLGGVSIAAGQYSTVTNPAGGWAIEVPSGEYAVVARGEGFSPGIATAVTVDDENIEVDFISGADQVWVNFEAQPAERITADDPLDVNQDNIVSALDVLLVINALNSESTAAGATASALLSNPRLDVNADGFLSPVDALIVINSINERTTAHSQGEGESLLTVSYLASADGEAEGITPPAGESLVNTLLPRLQTSQAEATAIGTNAAGNTIVVFGGTGPIDNDGVFARRYDSDGQALGNAFRVNTTIREVQKSPSVAVAANGDFLVAWDGRGPGDQHGIFAQWFTSSGTPIGSETLVNTTTGGYQQNAAVAMADDGSSVIVWCGTGIGDVEGIFMQRYDTNRNRIGGEVRVNTTTANEQSYPSVAMTGSGQFVVTWSSRHQDGSDWGVYGQRYDSQGQPVSGEFAINTTSQASQFNSSVAIAEHGHIAVVWSGYADGDGGWNIYAQHLDAQNNPVGGEMLVNNSTTGHQKDAKIAVTPRGRYVISWTSGVPDGSGWEVFAKVYESDASLEGTQFQVNTVTLGHASGHQGYTAVAVGNGPRAWLAWSGRGREDRDGVYLDGIGVGDESDNHRPEIDPVEPQVIDEQVEFTLPFTASDPDNDDLTWEMLDGPQGAQFDPATATFTWTPTEAQGPGQYSVTVQVTDDGQPALADSITVGITVLEVNSPPVLNSIGDREINEEELLAIHVTATDPNDIPPNDLTLTVTGLPAGAEFDAPTGMFSWTPLESQQGQYVLTFTVTDDGNPNLSDSETITITVNEVNDRPILQPIGDKQVDEENPLAFTVVALDYLDDPENNLVYSATGLPVGATFDEQTGEFNWTPTESQNGQYEVVFTATDDGLPPLSDSETITITVNEVNDAPILDPVGDKQVDELTALSFTVTASDINDDPANNLTLSIAGLPAGADFDPGTGVFSWTPSEAQGPNDYTLVVKVTDDGIPSLSDTETITITVNEVNEPPIIEPIGDQQVDEEQLLTFTVIAHDDNDTTPNDVTLSIEGLPSGATFQAASGLFSWTPTESQQGEYVVIFTATDDGQPNLTDTETVTITVNEVNDPPVLDPIGDQQVNELTQLTFTVSASDPNDDPTNQVTLGVSGLPSGADFDPATGAFTWTPTEDQGPDQYVLTFTATDDGTPPESDSETVTITVNEVNTPPVLDEIDPQFAETGELLTFTATATDADLPPNTLTFSLDAGAPMGASIDPNTGVFEWTPTESQGPGPHSVVVRVTDSGVPSLDDAVTVPITVTETLVEGSDFVVSAERNFTVPSKPTAVMFSYDNLIFDTTDPDFINDAFEVALVDEDGNSLVATYTSGRDAYFNITEDLPEVTGAGVVVDGQTVTVGLNGIPVGTAATLIFRLVNNDADENTTVRIVDFQLIASDLQALAPSAAAAPSGEGNPPSALSAASSSSTALAGPQPSAIPAPDPLPTVTDPAIIIGDSSAADPLNFYGMELTVQSPPNGSELPAGSQVIIRGNAVSSGTLTGPSAGLITFESIGGDLPVDGLEINTQFLASHGVTFELEGGGSPVLAKVGEPKTAFSGPPDNTTSDTPAPDQGVGQFFLTDDGVVGTSPAPLLISYSNPVAAASGYILDIDGWFEQPSLHYDTWLVQARNVMGETIDSIELDPTSFNAGDGLATPWSFNHASADIYSIRIAYIGPPIDVVGLAFDNFAPASAAPVQVDNQIAYVTINGLPVDVLDQGGNFFAQVEILPGDNVFEVVATDLYGQTASETLTIAGVDNDPDEIDFTRFADITGSFTGVYGRTSFNEADKILNVNLATRNDGTFEADVPLLVGIKSIDDASVWVASPDGYTPDGIPYYDYTAQIPAGKLAPAEQSLSPTVSFHNPDRVQFKYELVFFGQLNEPPVITSMPDIDAFFDEPYTYDVAATDPDGDMLTYRMVSSPQAMTIDEVTGEITWQPTESDAGNHDIVVRVDDGRGGRGRPGVYTLRHASAAEPPTILHQPAGDCDDGIDGYLTRRGADGSRQLGCNTFRRDVRRP
jgi:hypothetical protein